MQISPNASSRKHYQLKIVPFGWSVALFIGSAPIVALPVLTCFAIGCEDAWILFGAVLLGIACLALFMWLIDRHFAEAETLSFAEAMIHSKVYGEIPYATITSYEPVRGPRSSYELKIRSSLRTLRFPFFSEETFNEVVSEFEEKVVRWQASIARETATPHNAQVIQRTSFYGTWYCLALVSVGTLFALIGLAVSGDAAMRSVVVGVTILLPAWIAIYRERSKSSDKRRTG
ncbi:hypothetical protein [Burkholderia ubonensis]|uniref:DUF3592 domain-containing protein n=1 Tax=Burkholderia ubonensis TaxID=101571 RepID=A0ABD6PVA3_9BURK|nr:hypothetical protein [Burkholderia ubonensis]OJA38624.1 hypothetical protein BGV66_30620 [Burkholderia ubonensis]